MRNPDDLYLDAFGTKEVPFRFRGRDYSFVLSHGLFSSAGIDAGSRFLLKIFSEILDECSAAGGVFPKRILDAGSGVGVLAVCAAGALADMAKQTASRQASQQTAAAFHVRAQDRDELGRIFTKANARRNGFGEDVLSARTEPLLAATLPPGAGEDPGWDLILSNVPAKAGLPVLEDFVRRSAAVIGGDGRVLVVVVNTLAAFFEERITAVSSVIRKAQGPGHTVFLYGPAKTGGFSPAPFLSDKDILHEWNPSYLRNSADYETEKTFYHLDTVYGAEGFDERGGETSAAAKLAARLADKIFSSLEQSPAFPGAAGVFVWEGDQGHFSSWFARRFGAAGKAALNFVLAGRNILALAAAKFNTVSALGACAGGGAAAVPAADLFFEREKILERAGGERFSFLAIFPAAVPETDRVEAIWEALAFLASPLALVIVSLPSAEAEKFDRKKTKLFTRLSDIRRGGFRALAYGRPV